jgi:hypothetical protein
MSTHLPDAVRKGLEDARLAMLRKSGRLCIHEGDQVFRVVKLWESGFAVMAEDVPHLRGLVDLYDGPTHVMQCLVVASHETDGLMNFEFKRATQVADSPAVDFERITPAPKALLQRLF